MNARELLTFITPHKPVGWDEDQWLCIVRAARLLADAEANDGTTPETDRVTKSWPLERFGPMADLARRLERDRNGLAARVGELEKDAERYRWLGAQWTYAEWSKCLGRPIQRPQDIDAAIDAARSKP